MSGLSKALLVARLRLLEARRDRRAFLTSLALPLVMIAAFTGLGIVGAHENRRSNDVEVKVAVAEGSGGADRLLHALEPEGIEVVRTREPAVLVVRERADVALTLPADADVLAAQGRPLRVGLLAGAEGRAAVGVATTEAALRRAVVELGGRSVEVAVVPELLDKEPKAAASALARTVPLLALVVALPFLGSGARALTGSRSDRTIEHLLPLPVPRSTLLLGLAMGTIGGEAVQQVLLLGMLAVASPILVLSGGIAWTGPLVLFLALATAAVTAGAIGVCVGSMAVSERVVGVLFAVTGTVLFATATVLQFVDRTPSTPLACAVPLVGSVLASRAALTDDGLPAASLVALVASTAAAVAVLLRVAGRRLASGAGLRL